MIKKIKTLCGMGYIAIIFAIFLSVGAYSPPPSFISWNGPTNPMSIGSDYIYQTSQNVQVTGFTSLTGNGNLQSSVLMITNTSGGALTFYCPANTTATGDGARNYTIPTSGWLVISIAVSQSPLGSFTNFTVVKYQ